MWFRFALLGLAAAFALSPLRGEEPGQRETNPLRERIIALARTVSAEDYAYTRTVRTEEIEQDKKETRTVIERWDPARPVDQRWTLVSIDARTPIAEEWKDYRKSLSKRRRAFYGRIAGYFAQSATSALDAKGRTVFRFASLPKESVMVGDADLSANASGEAIVNASGDVPFIEEVRFHSSGPTRVKLIAKIERFETITRYRMMPEGKPVPIELVSDMSGSMLGHEGRVRTRITYQDQRAVPK
ncbi:MAG TPA: hypothetical protein VK474_06595 [Chthoniobacterales bacterium]|nr:hypothetical protein [Chthoniobacterales bacterium]